MNPARQFLHILLKDIRGHALEIGLVLALNVALVLTLTETWAESLIIDSVDMLTDPTAQLLLVLAWCTLIGRVVQGDGVAGKAPYWLTRPYTRPAFLASKLVFVLLFVHLPLYMSHLVIVTGSGVPLSLVQMLMDQVVLAVCVSLPAMALAVLTTSFSRFVFCGVAVTAAAMFVAAAGSARNSLFAIPTFRSDFGSQVFLATALGILAVIVVVALACQYRWRSTLRVAVSSFVAVSVLVLGMLTLPTVFFMQVRAAIVRPPTVAPTIRFREQAEPLVIDPEAYSGPLLVFLPIEVTDRNESDFHIVNIDVRGAAGREIELSGAPRGAELRPYNYSDGNSWLILRISRSDYDSLKDDLVSVHLIVEVETHEIRETEPIPLDESVVIVDGHAQCGLFARSPGTSNGRPPIRCRTSSGWTTSSADLERQDVQQLWLPVRLRFEIDPIVRVDIFSDLVGEATIQEIPTSLRRRVSYTRQDVTFENIRLGDWGP